MPALAKSVMHADDDRFRVTEWQFEAGAETGWHKHGHDYVIVPLTDGTLGLDYPDGSRTQANLSQGQPYARRAGVEHNVTNAGLDYLAFLEVEVVDDHLAQLRRETMLRLADAFNNRDLAALMACMSNDCAFHASAGPDAEGTRHIGRDAVQAAYAGVFETLPQAAWTEASHVVAGDMGLSSWRLVGTDKTGRTIDVHGCDIFRFDGTFIALKDSYRKARG